MRDGAYVYYALQHKCTHESPWRKPQGKLEEVSYEWCFSNWEKFGSVAEPWRNTYKEKPSISYQETNEVFHCVGRRGWRTLDFAIKGLQRLKSAQQRGKLDTTDEYGRVCQAARYQFRLVKIEVSQKTTVPDISVEERFRCVEE